MYVLDERHIRSKCLALTRMCSYKFRQSSNFWYLTGIEEQEAAIILQKTSEGKGHKMWLFVQERDAYDELWHGPRYEGLLIPSRSLCTYCLLPSTL